MSQEIKQKETVNIPKKDEFEFVVQINNNCKICHGKGIVKAIEFGKERISACICTRIKVINKENQNQQCVWVFDPAEDHYLTGCANTFLLIDSTTKDNGFEFCPFCGKRLIEI